MGVYVITGAASGIGEATALLLNERGYKLALLDQNPVTEVLKENGVWTATVDVSNLTEVEEAFYEIEREFGTIHGLINCAAITPQTQIDDITDEEWDRVMAVNLKGAFFCARTAAKNMKKNGGGVIVNMSSLAGKAGSGINGLHYCISKAGILNLTIGLAKSWAKDRIRVNAVAPGPVRTPVWEKVSTDALEEAVKKLIPLGRIATSMDIAKTIAFLLSEDAEYITGEVLDVNGGMLMDY